MLHENGNVAPSPVLIVLSIIIEENNFRTSIRSNLKI
jgi:hypothetical protein